MYKQNTTSMLCSWCNAVSTIDLWTFNLVAFLSCKKSNKVQWNESDQEVDLTQAHPYLPKVWCIQQKVFPDYVQACTHVIKGSSLLGLDVHLFGYTLVPTKIKKDVFTRRTLFVFKFYLTPTCIRRTSIKMLFPDRRCEKYLQRAHSRFHLQFLCMSDNVRNWVYKTANPIVFHCRFSSRRLFFF